MKTIMNNEYNEISTNQENNMNINEPPNTSNRVADAVALTGSVGCAVALTMTDRLKLQITTTGPAPNPLLDILMLMWGLPVTIACKMFRLYHRHMRSEEGRRAAIAGC